MFDFFRHFADKFIAQGDYALPFRFIDYVYKNFFLWSFQSGAANLDGILRIPGRLIVVGMFGVLGNLAASYFYLGISYTIVAVSFWVFLRYFLQIRSKAILITLTLLVVLSPALLGNTAKVGLVAAAGLIPLCLLFTKKFFATNKFVYLFGIILCLNYSLIHPYNFTMNLMITGAYAAYLIIRYYHRSMKKYLLNIGLALGAAVLMSLYFILPVLSIGSIDKSVLSQDITTEPTDYTGIINVANAGDPISAFTLSKHVFLDFNYYTATTYIFYTIGVLALYGVVIGLYALRKEQYSRHDRAIYLMLILGVVGLIFMSSGHILASTIFHHLVTLPGGWIFRSPLKWQLYIPFFLTTALAIQIKYIHGRKLRYLLIGLATIIVLQSAYLLHDIHQKLLTPRTVQTFSQLDTIKDGSRMLYFTGTECANYLNKNPTVNTELNQVLNSKQIQVKKTSQLNDQIIKLNNYDFILMCKEDGDKLSNRLTDFSLQHSFGKDDFRLYQNKSAAGDVSSLTGLYKSGDDGDINLKSSFAERQLQRKPSFVSKSSDVSSDTVTQVYSDVDDTNVSSERIGVSRTVNSESVKLYNTQGIYYRQQGNVIDLSQKSLSGYKRLESNQSANVTPTGNKTYRFVYHATQPIQNIVKNGSFESGQWNEKVQDCFNYDDQPDIAMRLSSDSSFDGNKHVELSAARHVACTTQDIPVEKLKNILLTFKYKSPDARTAGYSIVFDDKNHTNYGARPKINTASWQNYSSLISVPEGAHYGRLILYGYPKNQVERTTTHYDKVSAYGLGDDVSGLFLTEAPTAPEQYSETAVESKIHSPTERTITLPAASGKHVLRVKESYSANWQLATTSGATDGITSLRLDSYDQGWLIDAATLCQQAHCTKNPDGTYRITLAMVYKGQQSLAIGGAISGATFLTITTILIVQKIRRRRE